MTSTANIAERIAAGDQIGAERLAREYLARFPGNPDAARLLGIVLRETGRAAKAVDLLEAAHRAAPKDDGVLAELAQSQRENQQYRDASSSFRRHAELRGESRAQSLEEAAACELLAGDRAAAARLLMEAGAMPPGLALDVNEIMAAGRSQLLSNRQTITLMRVLAQAQDAEARLILTEALWRSDDPRERALAANDLPNLLYRLGRVDEAVQVYAEAVDQGFTVGDFRPQMAVNVLAAADSKLAQSLFRRDREAFNAGLQRGDAEGVHVWQPVMNSLGNVELRGASAGNVGAVSFEWAFASSVAEQGARRIAGAAIGQAGSFTHWHAMIEDALPGQTYSIRMAVGERRSAPIEFHVPAAEPDAVGEVTGDIIGNTAAVLAARLAPVAAGAQWRFEYGQSPRDLDCATPWQAIPPPRTSRSYRKLYRHEGEWLPTSVKCGWVTIKDGGDGGEPALLMRAPFAKDRNQMTGIGAHDMAAGLCWTSVGPGVRKPEGRICWPVTGGVQDLRDAEISFTVCGQGLEQRGAALHFWVTHAGRDQLGEFRSQWALTGSPFPDDVLAGGKPRKVSLTLPNNPRAWTYTGNNPKEQGAQANRYRRAPLDVTLGACNAPSVFIFAFGDVRRPPSGDLVIRDAEIVCRDASVLSQAAGATLIRFPPGGADPLLLTAGLRGYDAELWTSHAAPTFPLEFAWELKRPVVLTHIQINQHPFWPAREVELLAEDAPGHRRLWAGVLPEGRPDRKGPSFQLAYLSETVPVSKVTLRILSGYQADRCGLDSVELYGDGAQFMPDGAACSVSAEIAGFTPGATIHYRVTLDDGGEMITSDVRALPLPGNLAPVIESAVPLRRVGNPPCYAVRANAMGLETELWGELRLADGGTVEGDKVSLGLQPTGRHIYYNPGSLLETDGAEFYLRARNIAGEAAVRVPILRR